MNKFVRILLVILAALIVAAGGFWSGMQFSRRQAVSLPGPAAITTDTANGITPGDRSSRNRPEAPSAGDSSQESQNKSDENSSERSFDSGRMAKGFSNHNRNRMENRDFFGNPPSFRPQAPGMMMNQPFENNDRGMTFGGHILSGGLMFFGLLFPLGFAILMVLGIIILFRMVRHPQTAPVVTSTAKCSKCGNSIQVGWKHCPECGEII